MGELMKLDEPSAVPAYLANYVSGVGTDMMVGGGMGGNRIGLKGSRFRIIVAGQEEGVVEESFLDVIIVGAAPSPGVARMYYEGTYDADTKSAPACYSADGVTPATDVRNRQSTHCATCPQNVKGSKIAADGSKTKACGYFKRLAVALPSDLDTVYRVDCKSMSVFGEGNAAANQFTLSEYAKKLNTRRIDPTLMVTRMKFDTDSSVPKLFFSPVRFITKDEAAKVSDLVNRDDTKSMLEITASTVDISHEAPATEEAEAPAEPETPKGPTISRKAAPAVSEPAKPSNPAKTAGPTVTRTAAPAKAATPTVTRAPAPAVSDPGDDPELAAMLAKLENE